MNRQKEIPRKSAKVKRGTSFTVIATGEQAKFHILRPDGRYLLWFPESDTYQDFDIDEVKETTSFKVGIKQVVKPVSADEKQRRETLDDFFDRISLKIPFNCMECNKPLYAFNKKAKRSVIAHLLPKSVFKSIATDPMNVLYLGADYIGCPCNCHDRYDMNVDIRKSMKVYHIALERFENNLKHKLTPQELKQAFTYLGIEWQ